MKKNKDKAFPDKKISETFLDFASPLFEIAGEKPTKEQVESALKLAFTVWNSVVFDTVGGNSKNVTTLKQLVSNNPPCAALLDQMLTRKRTLFGDDLRLIGEYKITKKLFKWNLRVEARDPWSTAESKT